MDIRQQLEQKRVASRQGLDDSPNTRDRKYKQMQNDIFNRI